MLFAFLLNYLIGWIGGGVKRFNKLFEMTRDKRRRSAERDLDQKWMDRMADRREMSGGSRKRKLAERSLPCEELTTCIIDDGDDLVIDDEDDDVEKDISSSETTSVAV